MLFFGAQKDIDREANPNSMIPKEKALCFWREYPMTPNLKIITLAPQMMHIPISWAKAEGWNPGLEDALSFYAADNHGFSAGYVDDRPLACISLVNYSNLFAFLGFFIVDPEFRGMGYGRQIWNYALDRLNGICLGLDGVVAQQDFYRRSGFVLAHRNIRYHGISKRHSWDTRDIISPRDLHYHRLCDFDARHFGFHRSSFLQAWLLQKNAQARIILQDSRILAFGVIRKCFEGYKIGPLFAEDYDHAERIFQALTNSIPADQSFYLDIPEPNIDAQRLVKAYAMNPVFETARMYKGSAPKLPLHRVFGITSFELG